MMCEFAGYRKADGLILRRCKLPIESMEFQSTDEEEFFLNCPEDATHIIDGEPVILELL